MIAPHNFKVAALAALLLLGATAPLQAQPARPDQPGRAERSTTAATLKVWNRPIVEFRAVVLQVPPAERAANAARRIQALPDDVHPDELRLDSMTIGDVHGVVISARERILFGIVDNDLDAGSGDTLQTAGEQAIAQLRTVLQARGDQHRLPVLAKGFAFSVVATVLLALVLWGTHRLSDQALDRLTRATRLRAVSLLGHDVWPLLNAFERAMVRLTAWGVAFIAVFLWLTFVLNRFPYTQPWGDRLGDYLVGLLAQFGSGALGALPGLFAVLVIFVATRFAVRLVDLLFRAVENGTIRVRALDQHTAGATRRIAAVLIWIFALTIAYEYIPGSETDAFKAIGIFTGLVVSLGSAGLVNHVMSGLVVAYSQAMRPGEIIQSGDIVGRVTHVGLLSTKVMTPKREEVTIPNAVLAGSTVTNYSRLAGENGAMISATATIGYDAPWRQVHSLLLLAAQRTPHIRKEPPPFVLQRALGDFAVQYELRAHIEQPEERFRVLSDLHANIQDAFNEFGVQIMSPAFESQPEKSVVVPKAKWFAAPAGLPPEGQGGST